ncbi:hypothetical protein [Paraflavitalea pollutisoli]|uniref:hypothetical protein n=1 Tax=Paraflavitalea pollutisoli TaxID=3034143 RepID=UPI0023EB4DC2|nr:hypothetical protein [Paraflavitalea sp. H1-2-19X]
MSKSKSKKGKATTKKAQPLSGMVVKSTSSGSQSKGSSMIPGKTATSGKKGATVNTTPRKAG